MSTNKIQSLSDKRKQQIEQQVKDLLHASRDCMRNQGKDTIHTTWNINDGYFGEAFGVMRALTVLGYGYFGPDNLDACEDKGLSDPYLNVKWWFRQLERQVLDEEGFDDDHRCEHCLSKYHKDDLSMIERGRLSNAH